MDKAWSWFICTNRKFKKLYLTLTFITLIFTSCNVRFDTIVVEAKKEKVTIGFVLRTDSSNMQRLVIPKEEWFEEICKSSGIEEDHEIKGDTIVYLKLVIPDPESADLLMANLENQANRLDERIQFHIQFNKTDSTYTFRLEAESRAFINEGIFGFISEDANIKASPRNNTDYLTAEGIAAKKVGYRFIRPRTEDWKSDSVQTIEITYPNLGYRRPGTSTNIFAYLFEEHLWATIAAVLGSIVSFVTILGYFRNRKPKDKYGR
jgi:hypothetical protein